MEKAVLISIQPKWCALIGNGKKKVEVRKTVPNADTPFKCYIYCTKGSGMKDRLTWSNDIKHEMNGKVIGEFTCDRIYDFPFGSSYDESSMCLMLRNDSCLTQEQLLLYGNGKTLRGWHIRNLIMYQKPKELADFGIEKAPQSWCYIDDPEKNCGNCKWHEHENIDDGYVCVNHESENCADWTEDDDCCECWEANTDG